MLNKRKPMFNLLVFYEKIIRKLDIYYSLDYMMGREANSDNFAGKSNKNKVDNPDSRKHVEKNLRLIFFDISTDYFQLSPSSKFFFLNECNRTSQLSKLDD